MLFILGGQRVRENRRKLMFSSVHLLGARQTAVQAINPGPKWSLSVRSYYESTIRNT
jgi:hypothetical protein